MLLQALSEKEASMDSPKATEHRGAKRQASRVVEGAHGPLQTNEGKGAHEAGDFV
jgi:hypothetical protein